MIHLRNPKTDKAYCDNTAGNGAFLVDNQFEADCTLCEVLSKYRKFEERTKKEFEEAKKKEEGKK